MFEVEEVLQSLLLRYQPGWPDLPRWIAGERRIGREHKKNTKRTQKEHKEDTIIHQKNTTERQPHFMLRVATY